ncbi:MAG: ATP-binding cassette domain-containing protein [Chloroflexi bacterium]|nr:ATP-binding cassette domain-containing protein [Chloroflexota bacterium]
MIEVRDLVLRFDERAVLDGLTFTVEPGELVCVLGPSGCGKTTLLRVLGGLLRPTAGEVRIAGEPAERAWRRCAFVFQAPRLVPWRTALDNVRLGQELRVGHANGSAQRYLEMVGLADLAARYPAMLSGGERQRVALARALAVEPEVILMDEPFSALDADTRARLRDEVVRIWRAERRTIVFVTHDAAEADALATRRLVLTKP